MYLLLYYLFYPHSVIPHHTHDTTAPRRATRAAERGKSAIEPLLDVLQDLRADVETWPHHPVRPPPLSLLFVIYSLLLIIILFLINPQWLPYGGRHDH